MLARPVLDLAAAAYVERLLANFGLSGGSKTDEQVTEPLSRRELDVLRLMARGAPNRRIAEELVVGVTTVKSHVNGIFRKLGAQSRIEAITRAHDLRLLAG